jgi:hypothetical protein
LIREVRAAGDDKTYGADPISSEKITKQEIKQAHGFVRGAVVRGQVAEAEWETQA